VKIPSLVVQPFIENALLHGLLHKKGLKKITINFKLEDALICEIIDNGIGRKEATKIKERQHDIHESFSTKAIKTRMKILSKQYKTNATFWYEDIVTNGKPRGTKVTIQVPFESF
jgi:sensor histidine kinase YesM